MLNHFRCSFRFPIEPEDISHESIQTPPFPIDRYRVMGLPFGSKDEYKNIHIFFDFDKRDIPSFIRGIKFTGLRDLSTPVDVQIVFGPEIRSQFYRVNTEDDGNTSERDWKSVQVGEAWISLQRVFLEQFSQEVNQLQDHLSVIESRSRETERITAALLVEHQVNEIKRRIPALNAPPGNISIGASTSDLPTGTNQDENPDLDELTRRRSERKDSTPVPKRSREI